MIAPSSVTDGPRLAGLIELVGEDDFEAALFEAVHAVTGCRRVSVVSFSPAGEARLIFAADRTADGRARTIGARYTRLWRAALLAEAMEESAHAFGSRLSINLRRPGQLLHLGIHAGRGMRLSASVLHRVVGWAEPLTALIVKHHLLRTPEREVAPSRLRSAAPALSNREAEVCNLITHGFSSEAIGLRLGISINTVKTYRRRAYDRLRISTQNELLRLALC